MPHTYAATPDPTKDEKAFPAGSKVTLPHRPGEHVLALGKV